MPSAELKILALFFRLEEMILIFVFIYSGKAEECYVAHSTYEIRQQRSLLQYPSPLPLL